MKYFYVVGHKDHKRREVLPTGFHGEFIPVNNHGERDVKGQYRIAQYSEGSKAIITVHHSRIHHQHIRGGAPEQRVKWGACFRQFRVSKPIGVCEYVQVDDAELPDLRTKKGRISARMVWSM